MAVFVDMVCVKTGLQMLNVAHAASVHIPRQAHAAPAGSHVSGNDPDRF